jgi:hypothetical protein
MVTNNTNSIIQLDDEVSDLETRVDGHDLSLADITDDVTSLETTVSAHEVRLGSAESTLTDHESRITTLETGAGGSTPEYSTNVYWCGQNVNVWNSTPYVSIYMRLVDDYVYLTLGNFLGTTAVFPGSAFLYANTSDTDGSADPATAVIPSTYRPPSAIYYPICFQIYNGSSTSITTGAYLYIHPNGNMRIERHYDGQTADGWTVGQLTGNLNQSPAGGSIAMGIPGQASIIYKKSSI